MKTKLNKTFIIVNKSTKEKWESISGKSSWKQSGHAKNAWVQSKGRGFRFDDQDEYEIVELRSDDYYKYQEAKVLLLRCLLQLDCDRHELIADIEDFIK